MCLYYWRIKHRQCLYGNRYTACHISKGSAPWAHGYPKTGTRTILSSPNFTHGDSSKEKNTLRSTVYNWHTCGKVGGIPNKIRHRMCKQESNKHKNMLFTLGRQRWLFQRLKAVHRFPVGKFCWSPIYRFSYPGQRDLASCIQTLQWNILAMYLILQDAIRRSTVIKAMTRQLMLSYYLDQRIRIIPLYSYARQVH